MHRVSCLGGCCVCYAQNVRVICYMYALETTHLLSSFVKWEQCNLCALTDRAQGRCMKRMQTIFIVNFPSKKREIVSNLLAAWNWLSLKVFFCSIRFRELVLRFQQVAFLITFTFSVSLIFMKSFHLYLDEKKLPILFLFWSLFKKKQFFT